MKVMPLNQTLAASLLEQKREIEKRQRTFNECFDSLENMLSPEDKKVYEAYKQGGRIGFYRLSEDCQYLVVGE